MSRNPRKWEFEKPKDFRDQVLRLPKEVRPKLTEAMALLSESDNPLAFGERKITKYGVLYVLWLNPQYRLSYDIIDPKKRRINIGRVGDHNFVYGKK